MIDTSENENKPYRCTKCGYKHVKGKVYEDHKQFAELNVDKAMREQKMDKIKYVQNIKPGDLDGLKVSKVETTKDGGLEGSVVTPAKTAIIKIEPSPEGDGAFKDVTRLDTFLLHASKKQVKLLLEGTRVRMLGGAYIANWRMGAWEDVISHDRIPFNVEEMAKYRPMIDRANGKRPGMLANSRFKRALRDATGSRGE